MRLTHIGILVLIPHITITGLELARLADLPDDVVVEAKRVATKLAALHAIRQENSESNKITIRRKALLRVTMFLRSTGLRVSLDSGWILVYLRHMLIFTLCSSERNSSKP